MVRVRMGMKKAEWPPFRTTERGSFEEFTEFSHHSAFSPNGPGNQKCRSLFFLSSIISHTFFSALCPNKSESKSEGCVRLPPKAVELHLLNYELIFYNIIIIIIS